MVLKTSSKRFTVGSSLLFIFLLLCSMFLAAGPLFKTMLEQGNWFDYLLAGFFYSMLYVFPIASILCWFYQELLVIEKTATGYRVSYTRSFGPIRFSRRNAEISSLDDLEVINWIGSRNMASISPDPHAPEQKRYATRGHWMMQINRGDPPLVVERRAKKEEVDWLKAVITNHFA